MQNQKNIQPISYVKSHAADVLKQVNESHAPMYVTQNGEARAVILDPESYQSMQDALMLLKLVATGEKQIVSGAYSPQSKVFDDLQKKFFKS